MSKTVKLSKEELQTITNNQDELTKLTFAIGQVEVQKQRIVSDLQTVQQRQDSFGTELFAKYGEGNISLETGEQPLKKHQNQLKKNQKPQNKIIF